MDTRQYSLWFFSSWFFASLTCLMLASILLIYLSSVKTVLPQSQNFKLFTSLPAPAIVIESDVEKEDGRVKLVEDFFEAHRSHLAKYSENFVRVADENSLDFRLLPAISMQETNGGRKEMDDQYNIFGNGIYQFVEVKLKSYPQAIEEGGRILKEEYIDQGLDSPAKIMSKYSTQYYIRNGKWTIGVLGYMEELK